MPEGWGGIGTRVVGVVAMMLMNVWADLMATCLNTNGILLYMIAKCIDDINTVILVIPKGHKWIKDAQGALVLSWCQLQLEVD